LLDTRLVGGESLLVPGRLPLEVLHSLLIVGLPLGRLKFRTKFG
jgi:hypothetical protein